MRSKINLEGEISKTSHALERCSWLLRGLANRITEETCIYQLEIMEARGWVVKSATD